MLLLSLFSIIIVSAPSTLIVYLLEAPLLSTVSPIVSSIINQLITFVFNIIFLPLSLTCVTLLYFDIRVRTEGFDLALLAAQMDGAASDDIVAETAVAQKQDKITPTGEELGYFVGLTVIYLVVIFAVVAIAGIFGQTFLGGF